MKIVVDINHPAHVHYFKNFIWEMKKKGHQVVVTASEKDITFKLLNNYDIDFINVGNYGRTVLMKMLNLPLIDIKYYKLMNKIKPDIILGFGSIRAAHVAFLMRKPSINFEDTEHSMEQIRLYLPFVTSVCTPTSFIRDLGKKQVRFNGYMELAALHPNRFMPNPAVLDDIGITEDERFIIVRFVSWQASHDIGHYGVRDKIGLVKDLERYGRVLITSEGTVPPELISYQVKVSPEKIHDLLYYASLYIGEGATMATEAALLCTPSILVSSLVGTMGNFIELEATYDLVFSFMDGEKALVKAESILSNPDSKIEWHKKCERLINDKIDLTAFMIQFVENYPNNFIEQGREKNGLA